MLSLQTVNQESFHGLGRETCCLSHEQKCRKAVESLGKHGFVVVYCQTPQEAFYYIVNEAADSDNNYDRFSDRKFCTWSGLT